MPGLPKFHGAVTVSAYITIGPFVRGAPDVNKVNNVCLTLRELPDLRSGSRIYAWMDIHTRNNIPEAFSFIQAI